MRIAIVNDSFMAVESLRRVLLTVPGYEIAWVANDGAEAVWRCNSDVPDLILMDLIMPVMDGVEATKKIMENKPCAILVVTSSVEGHSSKVFQAMGNGALDAVNTPVLGMTGDSEGKEEFLHKVANIGKLIGYKKGEQIVQRPAPVIKKFFGANKETLVAIGSSSGGPRALAILLQSLPENFPAPIVIIQHVDEHFSAELASWLDRQCSLKVRLAVKGDRLKAGNVYIAGSNNHLVVNSAHLLDYTPEPVDQVYRPSVDVFFNSVADNWGGGVIAALLTGMGRDGAAGLLRLRNKGMSTIAQNEESCTVYGMPRAAVQLGAAEKILSLDDIGNELVQFFAAKPSLNYND